MINYCTLKTQATQITIIQEGVFITAITFGSPPKNANSKTTPLLQKAAKQITEYLAGQRTQFDLPIKFTFGTAFQQAVWAQLLQIPYGQTRSYKDIAATVGNIKACRAVGMANNKNPIAIVVPCHRVIGARGKLVGYAAGLKIKEYFLDLERSNTTK